MRGIQLGHCEYKLGVRSTQSDIHFQAIWDRSVAEVSSWTHNYPGILHSGVWSDIHRLFRSLVSDPCNTGLNYQTAAHPPPQKKAGKNNSVPCFINCNVQKKRVCKWLNAINIYIIYIYIYIYCESLCRKSLEICRSRVKFCHFLTIKRNSYCLYINAACEPFKDEAQSALYKESVRTTL